MEAGVESGDCPHRWNFAQCHQIRESRGKILAEVRGRKRRVDSRVRLMTNQLPGNKNWTVAEDQVSRKVAKVMLGRSPKARQDSWQLANRKR